LARNHWISEYLYKLRYFFLLTICLFFVSLGLGYVLGEMFSSSVLEVLRQIFGGVGEVNPVWLMLLIFLNNSVKSFFAILLGVLFAIVPLSFVVLNGFVLGVIVYEMVRLKGALYAFVLFAPHGVIEIPAILFSSAIGVRLGYELFKRIKGEGNVGEELIIGVRIFIRYILPLLLVAAIIEAFVTPLIASILF